MGEHRVAVAWQPDAAPFTYETYSRQHTLRFKDGQTVTASAAPAYRGDGAHADPEDLLVAALSACHMLSFLAICARKRIAVRSYQDDAVGFLEPDRADRHKLWVTRVILRPVIDCDADAKTLADIHHLAHRECYIANSVKTEVTVETPGAA